LIDEIEITNFRSLKNVRIELKPITVIYGENSSGKSSLFYSLLVARNVLNNPNQPQANFFNLRFLNLGGFDQVVFDHSTEKTIGIGVHGSTSLGRMKYEVSLKREGGSFHIKVGDVDSKIDVTFPYQLNVRKEISIGNLKLSWNGVNFEHIGEVKEEQVKLIEELNSFLEEIRSIDIAPIIRGFTKPIFSKATPGPYPITEDEIANEIVSGGGYLEGKVHSYFRKIFGKSFRSFTPPGSTNFYLRVMEEDNAVAVDLVNEGFGENQVIYILAKLLRSGTKTLLIEEPEIHLNPNTQREFVRVLHEMVKKEGKRVMISTHSEAFVSSILHKVATKKISPKEVVFYLCEKKGKETAFRKQEVNEMGQIKGRLIHFMRKEIEEMEELILGPKGKE